MPNIRPDIRSFLISGVQLSGFSGRISGASLNKEDSFEKALNKCGQGLFIHHLNLVSGGFAKFQLAQKQAERSFALKKTIFALKKTIKLKQCIHNPGLCNVACLFILFSAIKLQGRPWLLNCYYIL